MVVTRGEGKLKNAIGVMVANLQTVRKKGKVTLSVLWKKIEGDTRAIKETRIFIKMAAAHAEKKIHPDKGGRIKSTVPNGVSNKLENLRSLRKVTTESSLNRIRSLLVGPEYLPIIERALFGVDERRLMVVEPVTSEDNTMTKNARNNARNVVISDEARGMVVQLQASEQGFKEELGEVNEQLVDANSTVNDLQQELGRKIEDLQGLASELAGKNVLLTQARASNAQGQETIRQLSAQIQTGNKEVDGLRAEIRDREARLEAMEKEGKAVLQEMRKQQAEIERLKEQKAECAGQLQATEQALKNALKNGTAKQAEIERLEKQKAECAGKLQTMEEALKTANETIATQQAEIRRLNEQAGVDRITLNGLQTEINQKDGAIKNMQSRLDAADSAIREREASIQELRGMVEGMTSEYGKMSAALEEAQKKRLELEELVAFQNAQLKNVAAGNGRDQKIRELEANIEQLKSSALETIEEIKRNGQAMINAAVSAESTAKAQLEGMMPKLQELEDAMQKVGILEREKVELLRMIGVYGGLYKELLERFQKMQHEYGSYHKQAEKEIGTLMLKLDALRAKQATQLTLTGSQVTNVANSFMELKVKNNTGSRSIPPPALLGNGVQGKQSASQQQAEWFAAQADEIRKKEEAFQRAATAEERRLLMERRRALAGMTERRKAVEKAEEDVLLSLVRARAEIKRVSTASKDGNVRRPFQRTERRTRARGDRRTSRGAGVGTGQLGLVAAGMGGIAMLGSFVASVFM